MSVARTLVFRNSQLTPWTYTDLDRLQRQMAAQDRGGLLVSELAPVITLGKRADASHLLVPIEQLHHRGVELVQTRRGGLATYHGPGQWVVFVVDSLARLTGDSRGVRVVVERLLQAGLEVARAYVPDACIREGAWSGVWSSRGKLVSVGIEISNGWVLHGLAINVFRTPTSFYGIRPCGLDACADYLIKTENRDDQENGFCEVLLRIESAVKSRFWGSSERSLSL